jgi:transglutaminase-like putative cysteine protease
MASILEVQHTTVYRYARPVAFGEHRVMFRPRPGHDLRVLYAEMNVTPAHRQRLVTDAFSNSIAIVTLREPATELRFECNLGIEHYGQQNLSLPITLDAERFPVEYTADERLDLTPFLTPWAADERGELAAWAQAQVAAAGGSTRGALLRMMQAIKRDIAYRPRYEEGTQHPLDTLATRSGTCRDYAHLMVEACRRLGIAARFVSGYLYDPVVDGGAVGMTGSGATHAWAEIYLPGAGWVPYDPTNALTGGDALIRVAATRLPAQASPLSGSFVGTAADFLGMSVTVEVRKAGQAAEPLERVLVNAAGWLAQRLRSGRPR